jgi:hypothetical protein
MNADELPVAGGTCTGGAHRCKAKQGRREDRADVWILDSKIVRFLSRVQSETKISLVTMARSFSSSSRKEVIRCDDEHERLRSRVNSSIPLSVSQLTHRVIHDTP